MEEHEAIAKLKQGDIRGLETLAREYYIPAVRAAYLVVQDKALAEDTVQTSFINLFNKIDQFDERRDFRPWFMRSVINLAISTNRRRKRTILLDFDDEIETQLASIESFLDDTANLEDEYINTETRQFIWQMLQKLTSSQRAAIVLRYYLEFSENEISQKLDRPKSSIKWTLFSARKKLRQLLKPLQSDEQPSDTIQQDKECA